MMQTKFAKTLGAQVQPGRLWTGLWIILLLGLLLGLAGCGRQNEPAQDVDPLAPYRLAMKQDAESQIDDLPPMSRYELEIALDDNLENLVGKGTIHVPNTSSVPWTYVIFRLYPALEQYGGLLSIQSATINGRPVPFSYQDQNTALRVELPVALLSGQSVDIYFSWNLAIPQWTDDLSQAYRLFGNSQDLISLPLFYPSLAVYQPGPTIESGRWWLERGTARGDAAFNDSALFLVTATLPSDQTPVTSGTLISTTQTSRPSLLGEAEPIEVVEGETPPPPTKWTRHTWSTGPVREFLLHTSNRFEQASTEAYNTQITSYWLPGQESGGLAALQHTAASLRVYSDEFGDYPYRDLRVATAPLNFRGMEYPQALLLGTQLYDQYRDQLEIRAVHEVAHQWWYLLVHNDPVNTPWMDEGLAEYSSRIYYEAMRGMSYAQTFQAQRWQAVLDGLIARGEDEILNLPVMAYVDGRVYESIVYGKSALFFDRVRVGLGERQFKDFLREYVETYRYQIVEPVDLWQLLRRYNPQVADTLFETWVGEIPAAPEANEESGEE